VSATQGNWLYGNGVRRQSPSVAESHAELMPALADSLDGLLQGQTNNSMID